MSFYSKKYNQNEPKPTQNKLNLTNFIFGLKSLINTQFIYFADQLLDSDEKYLAQLQYSEL